MFDLTFRETVLLLPIATALHVFEEWPRFPRWARQFASPRYSDREYVITHIVAMALAVFTAALLWAFPRPWMVLLFFAFVLGPGVFWNALFHTGASALSRTYCAGMITGVLLYIPLTVALAERVLREGILNLPVLLAAFGFALVLHTVEVGHNVFKRW